MNAAGSLLNQVRMLKALKNAFLSHKLVALIQGRRDLSKVIKPTVMVDSSVLKNPRMVLSFSQEQGHVYMFRDLSNL